MTDPDGGLIAGVRAFLSGVRRPQSAPTDTPAADSGTVDDTPPVQPIPFAVAVESMCSVEELAQLLHAANNEVSRLDQALPAERLRAQTAFARRDTTALQLAWDAERELNDRLFNERERQRILHERLQIVTQGEVTAINSEVRSVAERVSAAQRERTDRLVQAIKAMQPIIDELAVDSRREMGAVHEKADELWNDLVRRCAGHSPAGQLQPHEIIQQPRLDRVIGALEEFAARLREMQQA